jgi:hypothetical protein
LAGVIVNVPYGGLALPPPILKRLGLGDDALRREHWRLTDPFLLDLARRSVQEDGKRPERPLTAYRWSPLAADPLGLLAMELGQAEAPGPALLTRDTEGTLLPGWSEAERVLIFERTASPYLAEVEQACQEMLDRENLAALVTMRSYPSSPQKHEPDRRRPRPQVALGSDGDCTPEGLAKLAGTIFRALGWWPQLNWPLVGAAIPPTLSGRPRLKALGLFLRRDLYLDERTGHGLPSVDGAVRVLKTFFSLLAQELDRVAKVKLLRAFPHKAPSNVIKADKLPAGV